MKRVGNLYDEVCSMENLRLAHEHAKKGKGWYAEVKEVDADLENKLLQIRESMLNRTYHTSKYKVFKRREGNKIREIYKLPYYPDRIAQWAIMLVIEKHLKKKLISTTYSAIKGRGIHKGLAQVRKDIRKDPTGTTYCLKMDVHHYYASINHDLLKKMYRSIFKDEDLLWILDEIIDSIPGDTGIPIGNYISQWSGNCYLSLLDHWLKEVKHVEYYYRYMDDMIILASSKEELHQLRKDISEFLDSELKLQLKPNWQVFPIRDRGVNFLGYRVFPGYVLLRQSIAKSFKKSTTRVKTKMENSEPLEYHDFCSANSYRGWLKYCNSWRLTRKYLDPIEDALDEYYRKEIKNNGS